MRAHATFSLWAGTALAILGGCGGPSDGPERLVPVSGTVVMENQPVDGVAVIFIPGEGTKGTGAVGVSDAEGKFTLMHQSGEQGIEPGSYGVSFSRMRMPNGSPIPEGQSAADVGAVDAVPAHFRNPERPAFTETIPEEGKQGLNFQL
ncbi:MAG: hypothetical protein WBC44_07470 [Planctomycetaceae bacterium]